MFWRLAHRRNRYDSTRDNRFYAKLDNLADFESRLAHPPPQSIYRRCHKKGKGVY